MIVTRKIAAIALAGVLFTTPLLAVLMCTNGTETCAQVSESPLRRPICQRVMQSQCKSRMDSKCRVCRHTLLPLVAQTSAGAHPSRLQTINVTIAARAGGNTTSLADALLGVGVRTPRHLLHCALLI